MYTSTTQTPTSRYGPPPQAFAWGLDPDISPRQSPPLDTVAHIFTMCAPRRLASAAKDRVSLVIGRGEHNRRRHSTVLVCLAAGLSPFALRSAAAASEPLPVAFRGASWQSAVAEVAGRIDASYILERGLASDVLNRPIRFAAEFLTGRQVLRWLARLGGLAVVPVDDRYVFGKSEGWPSAWRSRAAGPWATEGEEPGSRGRLSLAGAAAERLADIDWSDQTPSAAVAEIRAKYKIDVVVDPAILGRDELLTIAQRQAALGDVLTQMANVWGATWAFEDGAVALGGREWLTGAAGQNGVARATGGVDETPRETPAVGREGAGGRPVWWSQWVELERKEKSWKKTLWPMMQLIGATAVWPAGETSRPRIADSDLQSEGKAGEILEGLRLLGYLRWNRVTDGPSPDVVEIRAR